MSESIVQKVEQDVVNVFDWIGSHAEIALKDIQPYLVPAETLISLLFPQAATAAVGVVNSINLIQSAIVLVKQKYAALGVSSATPAATQLADILQLVTPSVTALLKQEGITYNAAQVQNLVNAVIAILQAQSTPATSSTSATTATAA